MAPLLQKTLQILAANIPFYNRLSLPTPSTTASFPPFNHDGPSLSAVSWGKDRLDIFGANADTLNLTHKYYDGSQWQPSDNDIENHGQLPYGQPKAVSWGEGRLDVFAVGEKSELLHTYYDSHGDKAWVPSPSSFEILDDSDEIRGNGQIAATSWGPGRLDVFALGKNGGLLHKYFDGTQWNPAKEFEYLTPGVCETPPAAVSWGTDRIDVFCPIRIWGFMAHVYWDGSQWSNGSILQNKGEVTPGPFKYVPTVASWGVNRLDVFAVNEKAELWHKAWDGTTWLNWEMLGIGLEGSVVAANSWGPNRIDVVACKRKEDYTPIYVYKYWDGSQWNPTDPKEMDSKDGDYASIPTLVSWGENRLDIFAVDVSFQLVHQAWTGNGWYPSFNEWEVLAQDLSPS